MNESVNARIAGCKMTTSARIIFLFFNTPIPEKTGSRTETRLNSPRGKYFKQRGERRRDVNLYSDDIPGVSVSEEQIEKLTLRQLKFWLKSRRIN